MPKLSPDRRADRLKQAINDIKSGRKLNDREIKQKLEPDEQKMLDAEWREQQRIRQKHRSAASAAKAGLYWKNKEQVRLEVLNLALTKIDDESISNLKANQREAEKRVRKKFIETYSEVVQRNQLQGTRQDPLATANNAVRTLKNKHGHKLQPGLSAMAQHYRDYGMIQGFREWEKLQIRNKEIEDQDRSIMGEEAYELLLATKLGISATDSSLWTDENLALLEKVIEAKNTQQVDWVEFLESESEMKKKLQDR